MYPIDSPADSHQLFRRSLQLDALQEVLPDREILALCRDPVPKQPRRKPKKGT